MKNLMQAQQDPKEARAAKLRKFTFIALVVLGIGFGVLQLLFNRPLGILMFIAVATLVYVYQLSIRLNSLSDQLDLVNRELNATRLMMTMAVGIGRQGGKATEPSPRSPYEDSPHTSS